MYYAADLETTTDPLDCRVWAWATCEIGNPENVSIGNRLEDLIDSMTGKQNNRLYFHNLKFDGMFIIDYLFRTGFVHVPTRAELKPRTFCTLISDKGQFYTMTICFNKKGHHTDKVDIYDSLKILPLSVDQIARAFDLPISKQSIDYDLYREPGYVLTEIDRSYITADVSIMAQALAVLFDQGLDKMTLGSNAMTDFKSVFGVLKFRRVFPVPPYDAELRPSYKGGYAYLQPQYKDREVAAGIVLDVNSLYPDVMFHQPLPYGEGLPFKGKYKTSKLYPLYVQNLRCHFQLKPGFLPTIQLKHNGAFQPTEYISSNNGEDVPLCLTSVDLDLFFQHYDVYNIEYQGGWKFHAASGLFREYINKWLKIKTESKTAGNLGMYQISKWMLNSLYGKFALNPKVKSKYPVFTENHVGFITGPQEYRQPVYIPVGTFITAWARYKTISSAQSLYHRFIYADTDSMHLEGVEIPENLEISKTKLGAWKLEKTFVRARYIRAKSYMELDENGNLPDGEKWDIVVAGLPRRCHDQVTPDNFKAGSVYTGKLKPHIVPGGVVLQDIDFTIKA